MKSSIPIPKLSPRETSFWSDLLPALIKQCNFFWMILIGILHFALPYYFLTRLFHLSPLPAVGASFAGYLYLLFRTKMEADAHYADFFNKKIDELHNRVEDRFLAFKEEWRDRQ